VDVIFVWIGWDLLFIRKQINFVFIPAVLHLICTLSEIQYAGFEDMGNYLYICRKVCQ